MVVLASALFGMVLGGYQAKRRGGNAKDVAQYVVAYGIAFALLGMIVAVVLDRTVV